MEPANPQIVHVAVATGAVIGLTYKIGSKYAQVVPETGDERFDVPGLYRGEAVNAGMQRERLGCDWKGSGEPNLAILLDLVGYLRFGLQPELPS